MEIRDALVNESAIGDAESANSALPVVRVSRTVRLIGIGTKVAVTLLAIAVIYRLVDRDVLAAQISQIDPLLFASAIGLAIFQIVVAAFRWRYIVHLLAGKKIDAIPAQSFIRAFYFAQLCGQMMPFGAGDAVRIVLLSNAGIKLRMSLKSVLLDRAIALLMLFVLALPFVALSPLMNRAADFYGPVLYSVLAALLAAIMVFALAGPLARMLGRLPGFGFLTESLIDMRRLLLGRHALVIVAYYFFVHGLSVSTIWLLAKGQHLPINFADAGAIALLSLLPAALPITIAGWGVRESLVVVLFLAAGLTAETALLLSLSYGTVGLVSALPGALIWLLSKRPIAPAAKKI